MFTQSDQNIGDKKSFFNPDFSVYSSYPWLSYVSVVHVYSLPLFYLHV